MPTSAITLSELSQLINGAVSRTPELRDVWVLAELSNVTGGRGTHWYMDLIEKDAAGRNLARIKAMIWAQNSRKINLKLYEATGIYFRNGIKVMIRGQVNYHPSYGMGFTITDVEPSYTIGDMERLRREILEALTKEGLIERNKQLPVPTTPQRIAVISAEGAAGYGDFVHQLASTAEGFVFYPVLFPARLQGDKTAESVIAALDRIEAHADAWDAVVIIRGGGAASDLNGFDNLELARRVARSPLPVIVGIGHERDRTVLDEIACVRCKTPTAVAAWLIDALRSALGRAIELTGAIVDMAKERLTGDRRRLEQAAFQIPAAASRATNTARIRLEQLHGQLKAASDSRISSERQRLQARLDTIRNSIPVVISRVGERLESLDKLIRALDPAETLKRGYSITRIGGKAIRSVDEVPPIAKIETTLAKGKVVSVIVGEEVPTNKGN